MDVNVATRPATAADLDRLAEMNARLIADEGSRNPMTLVELRERARTWLDDRMVSVTIATRDDDVIGYVVCRRDVDEYEPSVPVVYIRQFFIERALRGRGLGEAVLRQLLATFPPRCRVVLDVLASNARAEQFWTKMGFVPYATTFVYRDR